MPSPYFVFFCNLPELVKEPYKRFLANKLRENFNLKGAPIQIYLIEK
jgi:GTP-binding protein